MKDPAVSSNYRMQETFIYRIFDMVGESFVILRLIIQHVFLENLQTSKISILGTLYTE